MKKIHSIVCMSIVIILMASCNKSTESQHYLHFDFQSDYQHDIGKIELDDVVIFSDSLYTMPVLGLAASDSILVDHGMHHVHVLINDTTQFNADVDVQQDLWAGINYVRANDSIYIDYSTTRFIYD